MGKDNKIFQARQLAGLNRQQMSEVFNIWIIWKAVDTFWHAGMLWTADTTLTERKIGQT